MNLRPSMMRRRGIARSKCASPAVSCSRLQVAVGTLLVLALILAGCASAPTPSTPASGNEDTGPKASPDAAASAKAAGALAGVATPTATSMLDDQGKAVQTAADSSQVPSATSPSNAQSERREVVVHVVESGDTLSTLAEEYGVSVESIVQASGLANEDDLALDQELRIPPVSGTLHVVQEGDTLQGIAALYNAEAEAIIDFNGIDDPDSLTIGQELVVPGGRAPSRASLAGRGGERSRLPLKPATYVVQPGDSVVGIAERFGITVETMLWANQFSDPDMIQPGTELVVLPVSGVLYEVQPGDTLHGIAEKFGADAEEILMANGIDDPDTIEISTKLLLPGGAPLPTPTPVPPAPEPEPAAPPPSEAPVDAQVAPAAAPPPPPAPAASDRGQQIVAVAQEYVGYQYVWGGTSPSPGFDCTGFVYWVLNKRLGIPVPRDLWGQLGAGQRVDRSQVQAGDLVFFQNTYQAGLSHVGIAIDNAYFIHASSERYGVMVSRLGDAYWTARWYGATRP